VLLVSPLDVEDAGEGIDEDDDDDNDSFDMLICAGDGNGDSAGRKGGDDAGDGRLSDTGGCGSLPGPSFISVGEGGRVGGDGGETGGEGTGDGRDDDDNEDDDEEDDDDDDDED
jgi:hypothetical protein